MSYSISDPRSFEELLASLQLVTNKAAAKAQLETAIWLWFHHEDKIVVSEPISIHTLASAVQGILFTVCREQKVEPSPLMKTMADQDSPDVFRNPQNFFKHGTYTNKKGRNYVPHIPDMTELIMADNVGVFGKLFQSSSPLLDLFLFRYSLSFPASKVALKTLEIELVQRGFHLDELARLGRKAFYDVLAQQLADITAPLRSAFWETHLPNPPKP